MHHVKTDAGFTLIEVMIGMVILTIVSLGLMSLTVSTIRGNAFSRRMTTASTLAQDQIEQVKRLGYANANTAVGTENYGSIADFPGFKRVTVIESDTPTTNVRTVTVTVSWSADTYSVASKTIVAQ
jgi:prepilin-type N-terminal cleavage/methylation domain-containing protein